MRLVSSNLFICSLASCPSPQKDHLYVLTMVLSSYERLCRKLRVKDLKFRAFFVAVAHLFADRLLLMDFSSATRITQSWVALLRMLSLIGKWVPLPGGSHDRVF